jgi:mannosyltransferase OCH1-like enzyme
MYDGILSFVIILFVIIIIICLIVTSTSTSSDSNSNIEVVDAPTSIEIPVQSDVWRIPKRIYQTQQFSKIPIRMQASMQNIIEMNPDFGYKYYDDVRARKFIQKHMSYKVLEAYDLLIPGAYKADLFRYCLLYIKGGIYLDSKFDGIEPLSSLITPNDIFVAPIDAPLSRYQEAIQNPSQYVGIYNGFLASIPEHPLLADVIELVVTRVHARDIGYNSLYITGPIVLGTAFSKRYKINHLEEKEYESGVRLVVHDNSMIKTGEKIVFKTTYLGYRDDVKLYNTAEHYDQLWHQKRVFKLSPVDIPVMFRYNSMCPRSIGTQYQYNIPADPIMVDAVKFQPRRIKGSKQKIPLIIHQTNELDKVPVNMKRAMDTITEFNPDYDIYYYNAAERRKFIAKHFDKRTLHCYDILIPGAYQADLFRYCVLYIKGGVYLDSCFESVRPLNQLIQAKDKFIAAVDNDPKDIYNAFIAAIPRHPILKKTIDLLLQRVERKEYGSSCLYVTGPVLLRDAFINVVQNKVDVRAYNNGVRLLKHTHNQECASGVIHDGSIEYFYTKYPGYRIDAKWYHPNPHYGILWKERRIYR